MPRDAGHAPFLLLSIRAEDAAADDEYAAMMRFAGLEANGLHRIRLTHRALGEIDLADWSGIILGGGPYNVSDAADSKAETQRRVESELLPLIARMVDRDFPFLGCCYGVGTRSTLLPEPKMLAKRRGAGGGRGGARGGGGGRAEDTTGGSR